MNRLTNQDKGSTHIGYTYTDLGSVETMTDATDTTQYTYTPNNLLQTLTTPDNHSISYQYDVMHRVKAMKDYSLKQFSYTYDAANRLKTINRKGRDMAVYEYSLGGALTQVTTPEGTTEYDYDDALQMVSALNKLNDGTVVNAYSYEYDLAGNQTKKTDNGQVTQYGYDVLNRLESVNEPDGSATSDTFDQNNNVMTKSVAHPASYEYSFKQNGADYALGSIGVDNTTYAYDANNRLLQERRYIGGDSESYSGLIEVATQNDYDPNGNLIRSEKGGQVDSEVLEYEYDEWNQVIRYRNTAGASFKYQYNGLGQRVKKDDASKGTITYYWDRGYISNERTGHDGWISANYVGVQGVFARETAENAAEVTFMMKNGHGDVTALVKDGAVNKDL